jgi:hypothetical protein
MDFHQIIDSYKTHKAEIVLVWLAVQTVAKALHDGIDANKDKKGFSRVYGTLLSVIGYLGLGKRA